MFEQEELIRRCCDRLLKLAGLPPWWRDNLIHQAAEYLDSPRGSSTQRALVGTAFAIWNGHGDVPISALLNLDKTQRRAVCTLLIALEDGPGAVERWLDPNKRVEAPPLPQHLRDRSPGASVSPAPIRSIRPAKG